MSEIEFEAITLSEQRVAERASGGIPQVVKLGTRRV